MSTRRRLLAVFFFIAAVSELACAARIADEEGNLVAVKKAIGPLGTVGAEWKAATAADSSNFHRPSANAT